MIVQVSYELRGFAAIERYRQISDAIRAMAANDCVHVPESTWYCSVPDTWTVGQMETALSGYIAIGVDRLCVLPVVAIAWRGLTADAAAWLRAHLPAAGLSDVLSAMVPAVPPIPRPPLSLGEIVATLALQQARP